MFFKKPQPITDGLIGEDERVCICSARIAEFLQPTAGGQTKEDALRRALASLSAQRSQEDGDDRRTISEETDHGRIGRGAS